jgi:hypothetical protein
MIASEIVARRKHSNVDRHTPLATIVSMPRPVVRPMSAEAGNSQHSRAAFGLSQSLNLTIGVRTPLSVLRASVRTTDAPYGIASGPTAAGSAFMLPDLVVVGEGRRSADCEVDARLVKAACVRVAEVLAGRGAGSPTGSVSV